MKATVGERGQVTIPKPMRDRLGIRAGQQVEFREEPGRLVVTKAPRADDPVAEVYGTFHLVEGMTTDAFIEAIRGPVDTTGDDT